MAPETWIGIVPWINAKRIALENRVVPWNEVSDLNNLIHDVLVEEHHGVETADDLPDQEAALRTLLSQELRRVCFSAERNADDEFYAHVGSKTGITDVERSSPTYLKIISGYVTKSQILSAIRNLKPGTSG